MDTLTRIQQLVVLLLVVALSPVAGLCQTPPSGLHATLLNDGAVALSWDAPPWSLSDGFDEPLDDYEIIPEQYWWVNGGYLQGLVCNDWKSVAYAGYEFSNFDLETSFLNVSGSNSRGLLFRGNGARDNDFSGYCFYISYSGQNYAMYSYTDGDYDTVIGWTPSDLINTGNGETNTLSVVAEDSLFMLFINDQQVAAVVDEQYDSGYVGLISSGFNEVWFDDLLCWPEEEITPLDVDELSGYLVYRNGELIGEATTTSFFDMLPSPGAHEYTVTAMYEPGGESEPTDPATVQWDPVELVVTPEDTLIGDSGGTLHFDVHLHSNVGQTWQNVSFWTTVTSPSGEIVGPLNMRTLTVRPYMELTVSDLTQVIPGTAPAGEYEHTVHLGYYPASLISDAYTFTKQNRDIYGFEEGEYLTVGGRAAATVSGAEFALNAWPNPFNEFATVTVSLPHEGELRVELVNVAGRVIASYAEGVHAAGQHRFRVDGSQLSTGVYFLRVDAAGQALRTRKLLLLK